MRADVPRVMIMSAEIPAHALRQTRQQRGNLFGLQQFIGIFGRAMGEKHVPDLQRSRPRQGQTFHLRPCPAKQLPVVPRKGRIIRLWKPLLMVARQYIGIQRHQALRHLTRAGSKPRMIPRGHHALRPLRRRMAKHRLQRRKIAVNVRQQQYLQIHFLASFISAAYRRCAGAAPASAPRSFSAAHRALACPPYPPMWTRRPAGPRASSALALRSRSLRP